MVYLENDHAHLAAQRETSHTGNLLFGWLSTFQSSSGYVLFNPLQGEQIVRKDILAEVLSVKLPVQALTDQPFFKIMGTGVVLW